MDSYGAGYIQFLIVSDDGSYVDPQDTEALKNYVVTGQNISPNTELKYVYETDDEGNEDDDFIESQNIEEIELYVSPVAAASDTTDDTANDTASGTTDDTAGDATDNTAVGSES